MANVVFFSFAEPDRKAVLAIKRKAMNSKYTKLDFKVKKPIKRWKTKDISVIRSVVSNAIKGTSRTIVFVGNGTYKSKWVSEEVKITLNVGNPVYAIRLKDTYGVKPSYLSNNNIHLYPWSETTLQNLASW